MIKQNNKPLNLIVEGNIGAGKSTFLTIVKKYLDLDIIYEPHDRWQNVGGQHNLLELFYSDTKRWAYAFQTYAFVSRVVAQEKAKKESSKSLLFERSVYSDRYCFAKNCYEMGTMTALEWTLYKEWFSWLVETHVSPPDGFIYLKASPEKCLERIYKRQRSEERNVPFEYIEKLYTKHEDWLIKKIDLIENISKVPVLVLDCEQDFQQEESVQMKMAQLVIEKFGIAPSHNYQTKSNEILLVKN